MDYRDYRTLIKEADKRCSIGQKLYREITSSMDDQTAFIIFPQHDKEINYYGMMYLDTYLLRTNLSEAIVVVCDEYTEKELSQMSSHITKIIRTDVETADSLISLYVMDDCAFNTVIISLDKPRGRDAMNLFSSGLFDKEQLVAVGIYFMIPFERLSASNKEGVRG